MQKVFSLLFSFSLLAFTSIAYADLIPPNSHYVERCVTIANLDKYPDAVLIGYITPISGAKYEAYKIETGKCLTKGYKFNDFSVYWITKSKFAAIDLNNLKLNVQKVLNSSARDDNGNPVYRDVYTPADLYKISKTIDLGNLYVNNSDPAIKQNIEYSIGGVDGVNLTLYLSKETTDFNNGAAKKVATFSNPITGAPTPKAAIQQPKSNNVPVIKNTPDSSQSQTDGIQENSTAIPTAAPGVTSKGFWQSISCFFTKLFGGICR